ncbi:lysophospholipid acyltransferase family protein [Fusobacterium necrogenes]|uniref:lysophospholipid acyltransferase family protein n=1 Tax=Fusobacterium necrogenes TaxID=858 RepID=UPI00255CA7E2|nr:lysophospholipid acyltransferase family protein [Fusobacterium necrogenes]
MKNFSYKLQFIIIMFFYKLILLLPEKLRFKFGDFLGIAMYKLVKKRRLIATTNLKMAFPEKNLKEIEQIAIESFKIMIKAFLCTLWFNQYLKDPNKVTIENREILDKAYSQNKGVIAALMHMGNMEAIIKAAEGYSIVTVAKEQRNPYLNKFINESRKNDLNLTVFSKNKSTSKELIKRLNNKEIFALFSDHRDKGAMINFFGMEAKAPTGAVSLALKFDIPLIWGYNYFRPDNSCVSVVRDFTLIKTENFKEDVINNTQRLITEMEEVIRKYPEQWMWFHDRWSLYSKLYKKRK